MTRPTVSVVIPVLSCSRHLIWTVDTVLQQTFEDFELLLVDADSGLDLIGMEDVLNDSRIRFLGGTEGGGTRGFGTWGARLRALNAGIAAARGTYIALLEAGDAWAQEKLAHHITHLERLPRLGLAHAGWVSVDSLGVETPVPTARPCGGWVPPAFAAQVVGGLSVPVVRREVLEWTALRDPSGGRAQYLDESMGRYAVVDCWTRIALATNGGLIALSGILTRCGADVPVATAERPRRVDWAGLRASIAEYAPDFAARLAPEAHAGSAMGARLGSALARAA